MNEEVKIAIMIMCIAIIICVAIESMAKVNINATKERSACVQSCQGNSECIKMVLGYNQHFYIQGMR